MQILEFVFIILVCVIINAKIIMGANTMRIVYTMGTDSDGQLGQGADIIHNTFIVMNNTFLDGEEVIQVAAGEQHSLLLTRSGKLYAVGDNRYGQLCDNSSMSKSYPVLASQSIDSQRIVKIYARVHSNFIVTENGQIFGCGNNIYGRLGLGNGVKDIVREPSPVVIDNLQFGTNMPILCMGAAHTVVLVNGTLYSWGGGSNGELGQGDGNYESSSIPVLVNISSIPSNETIVNITCGAYHTTILTDAGSMYSWGKNVENALGIGTTVKKLDLPTKVDAPKLNGEIIKYISCGKYFCMAITNTSKLYSWGANGEGQLGIGSIIPQSIPTQVTTFSSKISSIITCEKSNLVITKQQDLYAWGYNAYGQLGDGSLTDRWVPVPLRMQALSAACGPYHTIVLTEGNILVTGWDGMGQLGLGRTFQQRELVEVKFPTFQKDVFPITVRSGALFTIVKLSNGDLYTFGDNSYGQLGDGRTISRSLPTPIEMQGILKAKNISISAAGGFFCFVQDVNSGQLYGFGLNDKGQLGDGTTLNRPFPEMVFDKGALYHQFPKMVAAGFLHTVLLTNNEALIVFGGNANGQLGDGTTNDRQIPFVLNISEISGSIDAVYAGAYHTIIMDKSGYVYACGRNDRGQLGTNVTAKTGLTFKRVVLQEPMAVVSAGEHFTIALDGQKKNIYVWGLGSYYPVLKQTNIPASEQIISVYAGPSAAFALTSSGGLYFVLAIGNDFDVMATRQFVNTSMIYPLFHRFVDVSVGQRHIAVIAEVCSYNYTGSACDIPLCNGIRKDDENVCNGRGVCESPNECVCKWLIFDGESCERLSVIFYVIVITGIVSLLITLFFITIIAFTIPAYVKVRKQRKREIEMQSLLTEELINLRDETQHTQDWIIPFEELEFKAVISEGSFGVVFHGYYKNSSVAIKKMKNNSLNETSFEREVQIMKSLRHPNIVLFMGVCINGDFRFIITEFMSGKSLEHALYSTKNSSKKTHKCFSFSKKVDILIQITRGMIYLHGLIPPLIHRDLKPSNVLLDKHKTTFKLCDFGASKHLSEHFMTTNIGTLLYMSPEVLKEERYNEQSDVYSFGILMWELFFEERPYVSETEYISGSLEQQIILGRRPIVPDKSWSNQESIYLALMQQCWDENPNARPIFKEIFEQLENIIT